MGSVRFGLYENFKKEIAHSKGTDDAPAPLELSDKTLAAFGAGIISSLIVVSLIRNSALSNTPESEFRSRRDKLIRFTQDLLMLPSKF